MGGDVGPGEMGPTSHRRTDGAREWIAAQRSRLQESRAGSPIVEIGFRVLERDVGSAGGVLGGGLAYRLFFWTLALTVLAAGALGFASSAGEDVAADGRRLSMGQELATTVSEAARQSQNGRWWLLAVGCVLVVWFAWSLMRALRLLHATAWRVHPGRTLPHPLGILGVLSVPLALVAVSATAGFLRSSLGPVSGLTSFAVGSVLIALIVTLGASRLPAPPDVSWTAHLPGAAAFVLVLQGISLLAQLYLADRLVSSQEIYGALGLAATLLFALYLVSRGLVWAFEINAVTWEVRRERTQVRR